MFNLSKKQTVVSLLSIFLLMGIFLPLAPAHAGAPWDALGNITSGIGNAISGVILTIPTFISNLIRDLAVGLFYIIVQLFDFATGIAFNSVPLTHCPDIKDAAGNITGRYPCVVDIGWKASRDLANMFFVVIMVVIAFGTVLRRDNFGLNLLPTLIIVAVLINFSQVLTGVIVDVSQITMKFFLQPLEGQSLGMILFSKMQGGQMFTNQGYAGAAANVLSGTDQVTSLLNNLMATVFIAIISIVFLALAFLFIVRMIALWVLTILSPLAVASLILPQTRQWWNKWFDQLLQWSFLGASAGIFLYFATIAATTTNTMLPKFAGEIPSGYSNIFQPGYLLQYAVILVFLVGAIAAATSSSAMGAQMTTKFAKRWGSRAGGLVAAPAAQRLGGWWEKKKAEPATSERIQTVGARMATFGEGLRKRGPVGAAAYGAVSTLTAGVPQLVRFAGKRITPIAVEAPKEFSAQVDKIMDKSRDMKPEQIRTLLKIAATETGVGGRANRLAYAQLLAEKDKFEDEQYFSEADRQKIVQEVKKAGLERKFFKAVPHLMEKYSQITGDIFDKVIMDIRPDDISRMARSSFVKVDPKTGALDADQGAQENVIDALLLRGQAQHFANIITRKDRLFRDENGNVVPAAELTEAVQKRIDARSADIERDNLDLARYLKASSTRGRAWDWPPTTAPQPTAPSAGPQAGAPQAPTPQSATGSPLTPPAYTPVPSLTAAEIFALKEEIKKSKNELMKLRQTLEDLQKRPLRTTPEETQIQELSTRINAMEKTLPKEKVLADYENTKKTLADLESRRVPTSPEQEQIRSLRDTIQDMERKLKA